MPEFCYQATDNGGQSVTGELSAENLADAIAELESRGLSVQSIRLSSTPQTQSASEPPREPSKPTQAIPLEQHFVVAVERKEILVPALTALADEMPSGRGRREIRLLADALRNAKTSTDLRRSKVAIAWLPLLVTGFNSESGTRRLSELISYASQESQNRSQRRRLFAYPMAVLVLAFAVLTFLSVAIVPIFGDMFDDFGLQLPRPTLAVIFLADQIRFDALRFVISLLLIVATCYGLARLWNHFALTTRLLGSITAGNTANLSAMSSLTSQLAELLSIDVSLPDALWIAGQSCQHYHFKKVAEQLARHAHGSLAPLRESPVAHNLPANVIRALEAGPGGKPNLALLRELSVIYGDRANERVDWSSGAIAQFAIIFLGITVGFVVIALFSPLVSLVTSLS
jgi:type IV pilus assembly protein PilC